MTAVPASAGTTLLICDRCGAEESTGYDGELVWPAVVTLGWSGSPFPTGSHRCPGCSLAGPDEPATATRRPSARSAPDYAVRHRHDLPAVVITPSGDLDAGAAGILRHELMGAAERGVHLVVDLHAVHLIDSTALGLLVRAHQQTRELGVTLALAAPSRFVLTVLHTMRLDAAFTIHPDADTALSAIADTHAQA